MKRSYDITITLENAAFQGDDESDGTLGQQAAMEVCRILRHIATEIEEEGHLKEMSLFDYNGNRVGSTRMTHKANYSVR